MQVHKINYMHVECHAVAQLVEALRYAPEDRGFDSRLNHSCRTQPVTEMSSRDISWGVKAAGV
jgi:hypothetical protein